MTTLWQNSDWAGLRYGFLLQTVQLWGGGSGGRVEFSNKHTQGTCRSLEKPAWDSSPRPRVVTVRPPEKFGRYPSVPTVTKNQTSSAGVCDLQYVSLLMKIHIHTTLSTTFHNLGRIYYTGLNSSQKYIKFQHYIKQGYISCEPF